METLRKTTFVCCLTYGIYGLLSVVQLGKFIPPLPLKPFLFLAMWLAFVFLEYKTLKNPKNLFLIAWLGTYLLIGQYLVETLFNYETTHYYLMKIEPFVFITSALFFALFVFFILKELQLKAFLLFCFLIGFVGLIVLSIYSSFTWIFDWTIVATSFFFYLFTRFKVKNEKKELEKPLIVLYGVSAITFIEQMVYLIL